jgi:hypothetical protein
MENKKMKDKQFLQWIHARLHCVHNENINFDYMQKLMAIIRDTPQDKCTPNICAMYAMDLKPTLSEIIAEGSKRIDDAVEAVIAKHEEETAYIAELKKEEAKQIIDQVNSRYFGRSQYVGLLGMDAARMAQGQNQLFQQMGTDQRDAMNQAQDQFGRCI